jgi:streptogramin lyase
MNTLFLTQRAVCVYASVLFLAGCGGAPIPPVYFLASTDDIRSVSEPSFSLANVTRDAVRPYHLMVAHDGSIWYTARYGAAIVHVSLDGTIRKWRIPQFRGAHSPVQPAFIVEGVDGSIWFDYIASQCENGIGHIVNGQLTRFHDKSCGIAFPWGIAIGRDGRLYVAEVNDYSVEVFNDHGYVTTYDLPNGTLGDYMTSGPDGNIWISCGTFVARLDMNGSVKRFRVATGSKPYLAASIAAGSDGKVWFVQYQSGGNGVKMSKITPSGQVTGYPLPSQHYADPFGGLAAGPDGSTWFVDDYVTSGIGSISTRGKMTFFAVTNKLNAGFTTIGAGTDKVLRIAGSVARRKRRYFVADIQ